MVNGEVPVTVRHGQEVGADLQSAAGPGDGHASPGAAAMEMRLHHCNP